MHSRYSAPILVAVAMAGSPLAAQAPAGRVLPAPVRPIRPVQPSAQSLVRQPSNLELQVQLTELRQEVASLSQQLSNVNALLTRLSEREARRYSVSIDAIYSGCIAAWTTAMPNLTDVGLLTRCRGLGYTLPYQELREP